MPQRANTRNWKIGSVSPTPTLGGSSNATHVGSDELESLLRQKDGEPGLMDSPPTRTSSGNPLGDGGHGVPLFPGEHITRLRDNALTPLTVGECAEEFGLSVDIISDTLGQPSFISDSTMFASVTAAPHPPIGPGMSDSPSMSAYISTGSPGSDTSNTQLVWKQSANLPGPDLLRHLYGVTFSTHASIPELTLSIQSRSLLCLSSPCKPAFTPDRVPLVSVSSLLLAS